MKTQILIYFCFAYSVFSQDIFRIGIGADELIPTGNFADFSQPSLGYSFYSEYEIDENITSDVIVILTNFDSKIKNSNSVYRRTFINSSLLLAVQYKIYGDISVSIGGGMNYIRLPIEYYNIYNSTIEQKYKTEAYNIISFGTNYRTYFYRNVSLVISSNYSLVNGHLSNFNNLSVGTAIFIDLDL